MRILFVLPDLPQAPLAGTHTRPLSMLKAAARSHEVVAVGQGRQDADLGPLRGSARDVLSVSSSAARPAGRRALAAGRRALSPVPLIGRGRSRAVAALVERAIVLYRPQALFLETMYAVGYRTANLPAVVDLTDVVSGLCEAAAAAHPVRYAAARTEAATAGRQETRLLAGTLPVTINDEDRERLGRIGVTAFTVPLAVTPPSDEQSAGRAVRAPGEPLHLLFVGSYLHAPNREAARFLLKALLPALRAAPLRFHLTLAGRAAPEWLLRSTAADVTVLSDADDLAPLYRATDVVLAPLAHGGGTKNKTLEAMAWGLPVVGTRQAFTGITAAEGDAYVRTPLTADATVDALVGLATDPERRATMGQAARRYVVAAHSPRLAEERAAAVFDAAVSGGSVAEAEALWRARPGAVAGPGAGNPAVVS